VLNIAASEGVSMVDLENIPGTGNEGRVTKKDILAFVEARKSGKTISTPVTVTDNRNAVAQPASKADVIATSTDNHVVSYSGNAEIIEMDRMRKLIAEHMVRSVHTSPHVTSFTEADVTNMVLWRDRVKKEFEKREGEKLTFTPLFIEAIVRCLKKYPWLNSSLDGNKIIVKKDINIGMAAALPSGNLIVPVIKNADQLNLVGLSKQVNGLANAARNNKLKPDDTQGGTFTLTNVGTFGSLMGTPIINQPQVAILAVGAIKKRPMVIETAQGDSIAIRHMMYLSMSYDHRIIDGALGATFLNAVAKELEQFDPARTI
jgi:2-oxoglutarate dehydrogenase E2 component (dihydrolipoamide succinyltransferase)